MKIPCKIYKPSSGSALQIDAILDGVLERLSPLDEPAIVAQACAEASLRLPADLIDFLGAFREGALGFGPILLRIPNILLRDLPPTPDHWLSASTLQAGWYAEMALLLLGSILGAPFAWQLQQQGRLVHDVLPIKADEDSQIGTGSRQRIFWHIEDAFSAFRAHYLGLLCLRNPSHACTTYSVPSLERLTRSSRRLLEKDEFYILPDYSQELTNLDSLRVNGRVWLLPETRKIAVIGVGEQEGELRLDPYFMPQEKLSSKAVAALAELSVEIDRSACQVALEPGDVLFVDNAHSVHGRAPFRARYDGSDRWLKRLNIAAAGSLANALQVSASRLTYLPT